MITANDAPDGRDAYQIDSIYHKMGYPIKNYEAEGRNPPSPDSKVHGYDPDDNGRS